MWRLALIAGLCLMIASLASSSRLVCYFNSEAEERAEDGKFTVSDIDPNKCTHLIYAFSDINHQHKLVPSCGTDIQRYKFFNGLKNRNPRLKTLLAVGGLTFDISKFSKMVSTRPKRAKFIQSAIKLLRANGFNGLNIDWRNPRGAGSQLQDKQRFTSLCKELREAFVAEGEATKRERLIITASVSAEKPIIDASYEVEQIAKCLDFINVLTFDFHHPWESVTGHHSPLYQGSRDTGNRIYLNTDYAMRYWQSKGAPAEMLNMGFAAYGLAFNLSGASSEVGAPANGPGAERRFTSEEGLWAYYETCLYLEGVTTQLIPDQRVPYATAENQWVGYDNYDSLQTKVNYLKTNSFGGAVVWSLDLDDFRGKFCKQGKYPFISQLHTLLVPASSSRLVCYFNSEAEERAEDGKFTVSDIDPNKCTHLIYAFSDINHQHKLVPSCGTDIQRYKLFNGLKNRNPRLKTLLAVGGLTFDISKFSKMVSTRPKRAKFIQSAIKLLRANGFNGLNIDWRNPRGAGSQLQDKQRFTSLCKELREAFVAEGEATKRERLIITASVSAEKPIIDASYEVEQIAKCLDFINVLTFDFHHPWESVTGHHSPLYQGSRDTGNRIYLNTDYAMRHWQSKGAPAEMLNMGFAAYGLAFNLSGASSEVGAPANGPGAERRFTSEEGLWAYYETCLYLEGVTTQLIPDQRVPYATAENQWVGYDNYDSLQTKVNYLKTNSFGGAVVWSLDLDDFRGKFCKQGKYPFISQLHTLLVPGFPAHWVPADNSTTTTITPIHGGNPCHGRS
ncbi:chitotriosidase-1-like [Centropristis striata]|uniref:chitotriosidase-1-like n=1 Tax=Centropristis striata TaxID=184440 RepID=UPI0027DFE9ED|nr:chitotriosidase-1-like [Centropristis striata]